MRLDLIIISYSSFRERVFFTKMQKRINVIFFVARRETPQIQRMLFRGESTISITLYA